MKHRNKAICSFVLCIILVCSLSVPVFANAPDYPDYFNVIITNLPEEAVYADLLIRIDENDPNYTPFQPSDLGEDEAVLADIIDYSEDGYSSFTLHYKNAVSDNKLEKKLYSVYSDDYLVTFCGGYGYGSAYSQYKDILNNYRKVKIALLDEDFKIIAVSEEADLSNISLVNAFTGYMYYDVSDNSLEAEMYEPPLFVLIGGFLSMVVMFFSVGIEVLAALIFGFRKKQLLPILIANVCTQAAMRLLYCVIPLSYWLETLILEFLIYLVEFLIYKKFIKEADTKKILIYTIVANTVTLLLGLAFNYFILT